MTAPRIVHHAAVGEANGPNEGYGFGTSPAPDRSMDEHRGSVRAFLAMIDPTTGYIEDD